MPRPKSDLAPVMVKLSEADRVILDSLADLCEPATRTEAVRVAIREAIARRQRKKRGPKQ